MSPDANRPETQTGSPDFVPGIHPTDNVRPFGGDADLHDVAPELIERGVPSADVIDPQTLEVPVDKIDLAPKKKLGKRGIAAIAGSAVATAVIGGLGVVKIFGGDDPAPEHERTTTSAGTLENDNEAPQAGEKSDTPQTTEFGLSAEKYVDNPKQIMIDFVDAYNTWQNTGVTKEAMESDKRYELPGDEYASVLNAASDKAFIDNMLVADWANNPSLVNYVDIGVQNHQENSWGALMTTYTGGTEETEAYRRYIDLDLESVVVQKADKDQIIVSAEWQGRDNADKNDIENIRTGGIDPNTETGDFTLTFTRAADGTMRLADFSS